MWSHQQCREKIKRYKDKVKNLSKRKRGNPPDVIKAMEILAGGKQCVMCGDMNTHLHHANGNWRDYSPSNLIFVCKQHHLQLHRELKENTNMRKTIDVINAVRKEVNALHSKGSTKEAAFEKLSSKYNKSHRTIENMYYGKGGYGNPTGTLRGHRNTNIVSNQNILTVTLTFDDTLSTYRNDLPRLIEHLKNTKYNLRNFSFNG